MKLVLDADVVVAAMRSPRGAWAEFLRAARQARVPLLASMPLALEYEAVCSRVERRFAAGLSAHEVEAFVTTAVAEKVSALRTARFLADRKARAEFKTFDRIMRRRRGKPPRGCDEAPQ